MTSRRAVPLAGLVLLAALLSGCAGEPDPVETPPPFATEDEAFAAAEETYRAYVDALNDVDLSDPETFEPVFAWTTGEANAAARESFSSMHADGFTVGGESEVVAVGANSATLAPPVSVVVEVCLDVSSVTLTDASGASVVESSRPDRQTMELTLVESTSSPTGLLIETFDGSEVQGLCTS